MLSTMSVFLEKGKPSQRIDAGNDSDMEVRNCTVWPSAVICTCVNSCVWQTWDARILQGYTKHEENVWSLGEPLDMVAPSFGNKYTLKLVLGGAEFYDTVCGYKTIEFRTAPDIIHLLRKPPVYSVMLYHAYFKAGERPYVEKKFEGCVVAHAGVHICRE
jgi:hypothetical protein